MSISNEVIDLINLKICEIIKQNWCKKENDYFWPTSHLNYFKMQNQQQKNIVFIAQSIDGFIADKNGSIDWLHSIPNPNQEMMGYDTLVEEIDAIVMGRTTYEVVLGFGGEWPYTKPVYVLSSTLQSVPAKLVGKVSLLKGTPQEILSAIHQQNHYILYIDGGRTVQDFIREDLIDELRITTIPILLGDGFPLFGSIPEHMEFEFIESQVFLNQAVQLRYKRKKKN